MTFSKKQISEDAISNNFSHPSQDFMSVNTFLTSRAVSMPSNTSPTIKSQFNFNVDIESFEETQKKNEQNALKTLITLQDKRIHEFVKKRIDNAILVENIGSEMTYSISNKLEYTKQYESFFHQIETNMDNLGKNYSNGYLP